MDKIYVYVYEDEYYRNLLPLVYLRPVFDLYCEIYTFRERIQNLYPQAKIYSLSRFDSQTLKLSKPRINLGATSSPTLFISRQTILHSPNLKQIQMTKIQNLPRRMRGWDLEFGIYLGFGARDLEFLHTLLQE